MQIKDQCGFLSHHGKLNQLLEGGWEFPRGLCFVLFCFIDPDEPFDSVSVPWGILWQVPNVGILFITFMDRNTWHSQEMEGYLFSTVRISSLLFGDYGVLLVSSSRDPQLPSEQFTSKCQVQGMKISTTKSDTIVLSQIRVKWQVRSERWENLPIHSKDVTSIQSQKSGSTII